MGGVSGEGGLGAKATRAASRLQARAAAKDFDADPGGIALPPVSIPNSFTLQL